MQVKEKGGYVLYLLGLTTQLDCKLPGVGLLTGNETLCHSGVIKKEVEET